MTDDISFNRTFEAIPGRVEEVAPNVRRILAPNPSPFTFTGTCSYVIGRGHVAIVDPGPDHPAHVAALLDSVRGESVTHILITHTHRDHSPAAAAIAAATGAVTVAEGPHRPARPLRIGEVNPLDASGDMAFVPDLRIGDGDVLEGRGWAVEAVTTPGHCANHVAFALKGADLMFSGDHVMGWATSIVAPPDGSMGDYVASLEKLASRTETTYLPGHGPVVRNAPAFVQDYLAHRRAREAAILRGLERAETIGDLVRASISGSIPASSAPPRSRCWPTSNISWRGDWWPLMARRISRGGTGSPAEAISSSGARPEGPPSGRRCARHSRRGHARHSARRSAHPPVPPSCGTHTDDEIIAEAEERRRRHRLDLPVAHHAARRHGIENAPFALADDGQQRVEGLFRRSVQIDGLDGGIGAALERHLFRFRRQQGIGVARPREAHGAEAGGSAVSVERSVRGGSIMPRASTAAGPASMASVRNSAPTALPRPRHPLSQMLTQAAMASSPPATARASPAHTATTAG